MSDFGGVACRFVRPGVQSLKTTLSVWRRNGIDGYGAQRLGRADSDSRFGLVQYDTAANVEVWIAAIEQLQGSIVTVVDDWGETWSRFLVERVRFVSKTPAVRGATTNARGELAAEGKFLV